MHKDILRSGERKARREGDREGEGKDEKVCSEKTEREVQRGTNSSGYRETTLRSSDARRSIERMTQKRGAERGRSAEVSINILTSSHAGTFVI